MQQNLRDRTVIIATKIFFNTFLLVIVLAVIGALFPKLKVIGPIAGALGFLMFLAFPLMLLPKPGIRDIRRMVSFLFALGIVTIIIFIGSGTLLHSPALAYTGATISLVGGLAFLAYTFYSSTHFMPMKPGTVFEPAPYDNFVKSLNLNIIKNEVSRGNIHKIAEGYAQDLKITVSLDYVVVDTFHGGKFLTQQIILEAGKPLPELFVESYNYAINWVKDEALTESAKEYIQSKMQDQIFADFKIMTKGNTLTLNPKTYALETAEDWNQYYIFGSELIKMLP